MVRRNDWVCEMSPRLIQREAEIRWLRDPQEIHYVRQSLIHCQQPTGFPPVDRLYRLNHFAELVGVRRFN